MKDTLVIYSGRTARYLLRKGYTIVDVKADKLNNIKSVFIFKRESNIEDDMKDILKKELTKEMEILNNEKREKNIT